MTIIGANETAQAHLTASSSALNSDSPDVGVVVIGRNEGERLRRCLVSVRSQADRVVYVDSGSSDGSPHVAAALGVEVVQLDPTIPLIHFGTDTGSLLELQRDCGGSVIGLDWRVELDQAWQRLGEVGIQGNLDPAVLYAERDYVRQRVQRILQQADGRAGHIFNLGHGILPTTPVDNVLAFIDAVHEYSAREHHDTTAF